MIAIKKIKSKNKHNNCSTKSGTILTVVGSWRQRKRPSTGRANTDLLES